MRIQRIIHAVFYYIFWCYEAPYKRNVCMHWSAQAYTRMIKRIAIVQSNIQHLAISTKNKLNRNAHFACLHWYYNSSGSRHHIKTTIAVVSWIRIQFFFFPIAKYMRVLVDSGRNNLLAFDSDSVFGDRNAFPTRPSQQQHVYRLFLNYITKIPEI